MFEDFLEALKNMGEYKEFDGPIYYDSKTNGFLQLRGHHDDYLVFGHFCKYYRDAKIALTTQQLSYKYSKKLILVKGIDEIPGTFYDGTGWQVKKNKDR